MTCHLEAKEVMERVEGRRLLRSWMICWSISEGFSVAGGGTVAGGICFAFVMVTSVVY